MTKQEADVFGLRGGRSPDCVDILRLLLVSVSVSIARIEEETEK